MSKNTVVFAASLVIRRDRLYVQPLNAASRQQLAHLAFPEGAALFRAVLSLVRRSGARIPADVKTLTSPYEVLDGKLSLSNGKTHKPKMRPLGEGEKEKRCVVCTYEGDGGWTCRQVPCKQRPDV
jgi:hypothetical protein